jgi:hypothetical protein
VNQLISFPSNTKQRGKKMILRIRTNVGMTKLTVDDKFTLQQLQKLIVEKLNISNMKNMTLSLDLEGNQVFSNSPDSSLLSIGLKHGDEVFLQGKFEETVIEKSYINDQHELIQAGKSLKLIEESAEEQSVQKEDDRQSETVSSSNPLAVSSNNENNTNRVLPEQPVTSIPAGSSRPSDVHNQTSVPSAPSVPSVPMETEDFRFEDYTDFPDNNNNRREDRFDDEGNYIRSPDKVQKMNLLGAPSPSAQFTPEVSF